jgi:hypothetical protein
MPLDPKQTVNVANSSRAVDLAGDSPELVAFALLRYLAQIEQQASGMDRSTFDRDWMLDAYGECLEAAKGQRKRSGSNNRNAGAARRSGKR